MKGKVHWSSQTTDGGGASSQAKSGVPRPRNGTKLFAIWQRRAGVNERLPLTLSCRNGPLTTC